MKRSLILGAVLLIGALALQAQTVDRDEFTDIVAKTVNFINYSGAYAKIDSLDQILAIGRGLSQGITKDKDSTGRYGERYRILHILGTPAEPGKPADVLILTEQAGVDHIDNIRRIISSYLSAAYGYSKADADILAVFVTVYNAVHRGNMTFYQGRYKASVMAVLSADKVGLSLRYTDWPGKTQIVIPLSLAISSAGTASILSSVSAKDLVTPEVIETIRDKPGAGTAERQKLADLMDRTVDETQNRIDQQKADLAKQQQATDQRLAEVKQQLAQTPAAADPAAAAAKDAPKDSGTKPAPSPATAGPAATAASAKTAEPVSPTDSKTPAANAQPAAKTQTDTAAAAATNDQTKALQAEQKQLEATQVAIKEQQKQLEQTQAENADTAKAAKDLRDTTAADLKNQGQENAAAAVPVVVLKNRLEKGFILGQAQKVIPASSEVVGQSVSTGLIGRRVQPFGDALLAIDYDGTSAFLVLLAEKDLALVKKGATVISPYSELLILDSGTECLAVMQQDGEWYLGRFDTQLNPVARSALPVDPVGALVIKDSTVLIQRTDGRITSLNLADLRAAK